MKSITTSDMKKFQAGLRHAARTHSTREVNVRNEARGYILFGLWNEDFADETPEEFANHQSSLAYDGVDNVAVL